MREGEVLGWRQMPPADSPGLIKLSNLANAPSQQWGPSEAPLIPDRLAVRRGVGVAMTRWRRRRGPICTLFRMGERAWVTAICRSQVWSCGRHFSAQKQSGAYRGKYCVRRPTAKRTPYLTVSISWTTYSESPLQKVGWEKDVSPFWRVAQWVRALCLWSVGYGFKSYGW